jgi:LysM repeat protein
MVFLGSYAFSADIEPGYQDLYDKIVHSDIYERYLPKSQLIRLQAIRQTIADNKYDVNHILRASKRVLDELDGAVLIALADRFDLTGRKYAVIRDANPELQAEYTAFMQKQRTTPEIFATRTGMEEIESFINTVDALYARANWQERPAAVAEPQGEEAPGGAYRVKPGDFLRKIAQAMYGDEGKWTLIYRANPQIENPDLIYPDMEFRIPPQP